MPSKTVAPLRCPVCGRQPVFKIQFKYAQSHPRTRYSLYHFSYECRPWFGLRRCFSAPGVWVEKDWGDTGKREALNRWNQAVLQRMGNKWARI